MTESIAINTYPEFRIVYSHNIALYEQQDHYHEIRTFVLVPVRDTGYVVVMQRETANKYKVLKCWRILPPAAITFHLDAHASYRLDVRLAETMDIEGKNLETPWVDIKPQDGNTDNAW